jgi:drug/metabolite transporter (DMT)-like permease
MVLALATAFVGIVVLLKPIFTPDRQFDLTIALLSGITAAIGLLNVRRLGSIGEPEWRIFFFVTLVVTLASAAWLTISGGWRGHDASGLYWLIGMAVASTAGQLAQTRAYAAGKTMLAANLSYLAVLFSALAGLLVYDETISAGGWLGMAIIVGAGIMATLRAARSGKRAVAPEPPPAA